MKKIILCTMLMAIAATTFCQETKPSQPVTRADYLHKSKNQKTAAWVLLGGGVALIGSGFLIGDRKESSFDDAGTGVVMGGIGLLATIGSIPLFIASAKNKKRGMAASAYLKMEDALGIHGYSMIHTSFPSLSVKFNLR
ncbi:MAG: hypothetical protein WDO71_09860 [Bacteroidota bacterium]